MIAGSQAKTWGQQVKEDRTILLFNEYFQDKKCSMTPYRYLLLCLDRCKEI